MTDHPHPTTPIEALLKERIGLDAASVGPAVIARAVEERRVAVGALDPAEYWNMLHAVPDELQALIEAVVVPETWFFRHREALLALGRFAAQRLFGEGKRQLRILSVPCSTGEEPYSIAMALLDAGSRQSAFVSTAWTSARERWNARASASMAATRFAAPRSIFATAISRQLPAASSYRRRYDRGCDGLPATSSRRVC